MNIPVVKRRKGSNGSRVLPGSLALIVTLWEVAAVRRCDVAVAVAVASPLLPSRAAGAAGAASSTLSWFS